MPIATESQFSCRARVACLPWTCPEGPVVTDLLLWWVFFFACTAAKKCAAAASSSSHEQPPAPRKPLQRAGAATNGREHDTEFEFMDWVLYFSDDGQWFLRRVLDI